MRRMASRFSLIVSPMVTPVKMLGLQIAVYRRTIRCFAPAAVHITAVAHDPCYSRRLQLPATRDETNARIAPSSALCIFGYRCWRLPPTQPPVACRQPSSRHAAIHSVFAQLPSNCRSIEEHVQTTIHGLEQGKGTLR